MAEKETKNEPKDLVEATPEEVEKVEKEMKEVEDLPENKEEESKEEKDKEESKPTENKPFRGRGPRPPRDPAEERKEIVSSWAPKTKLGIAVKTGKEKDLDKILSHGKKILESQIVDALIPVETDLILIGQAKGKFGGGKRRAWRQTQKKTKEGNVLSFSAMAVAGDKDGHVGIGFGRARETLPAREKAVRNAKINIMKIKLGFESPQTESEDAEPHTVPFKIEGKCGSVRLTFWPAPRGTGLVTGDECKKILSLAGVKDVYARAQGKTKTTFNLAKACIDALKKTTEMRE
jgi:small subunit ribosomal protein S5